MRWLVVVLAALAALAACNRLFSISEIPYAGDAHAFEDAPPDAAPMAILEIGDPALDFGQVTRGQSSFAATVGITNVGDGTTGILGMTATGAQGDYVIDLGTCNTTLAPGAGCKLKITFMPVDVGTFNETVVIGDGVAMTTIMLTGMGLTPGALTINSPIDFGSAPVGSTSSSQNISVMNGGGTAVTIESIGLSGAGSGSYMATPTGFCVPGQTLSAGNTCVITVGFVPATGGTQLASLVVTTATGAPSTSSLGGTGTTTVTVTEAGTASGTVESSDNAIDCGATCSATFDTSTVTLTGVVPGQTTIGWSPNCVMQSSTSCAITVNHPSFNVTATFNKFPVLTVALSGSPGRVTGGGIDCESANGPTCSMAYQPGTSVLLTATPGATDVFNDWTGACAASGSACSLLMTSNLSTTADFEPNGGNVLNVMPELDNDVSAGDGISVGSQLCDVTRGCSFAYTGGAPSSVTITANPGACATFLGFMGPCGSDDTFFECTVDPAAMQTTNVLFAFGATGGITDVCAQVVK